MKIIVGLGNPGGEYERTRHNVGWMVVDRLAARWSAGRLRAEGPVMTAEAFWEGEKIYLIKPQTFMNCSGQALAGWLGRFRELRDAVRAPEAKPVPNGGADPCVWPGLLVVSDEVHLPLGRIRIRPSGSAGGHNGLKDVEKALGGRGYPRLRLGVGEPPERMDRMHWVLGRFGPAEAEALEAMLIAAVGAAECWAVRGLEAAREAFNGREA